MSRFAAAISNSKTELALGTIRVKTVWDICKKIPDGQENLDMLKNFFTR